MKALEPFDLRNLENMNLAFGWVTRFIESNGIRTLPTWWSFIIETCGFLSWFVLFMIFVSLFTGFAKQMSGITLYYDKVMNTKLDHPYKWSFIFALVYAGLHMVSFWVSLVGVYLYKYGFIYAFLIAVGGVALLWALAYSIRKISKKDVQQEIPALSDLQQNMQRIEHVVATMLTQQDPQITHANVKPQAAPEYAEPKSDPPPQPPTTTTTDLENALEIFGLKKGYTEEELKTRYRELAKRVHSSRGGSDALYRNVKDAYNLLLQHL